MNLKITSKSTEYFLFGRILPRMTSIDEKASNFEHKDETLHQVVANILKKIELLKDFVSLYLRRKEVGPDIIELENRLPNAQQLLFECNAVLKTFETTVVKEYADLLETMRRQQMAMLFLLSEIQKKSHSARELKERSPLLSVKQKNNQVSLKGNRFAYKTYTPFSPSK